MTYFITYKNTEDTVHAKLDPVMRRAGPKHVAWWSLSRWFCMRKASLSCLGPGPTIIARDIVVFLSFCTKVRGQDLKLQDWTLNYRTEP